MVFINYHIAIVHNEIAKLLVPIKQRGEKVSQLSKLSDRIRIKVTS